MKSKYNELSGKDILTVTPYGVLMDLIIYSNIKIYLYKLDGNTYDYSLDKIFWKTLNKGLGKELYKMSEYCENIIIVEELQDEKED